jgi:hypothetical protein
MNTSCVVRMLMQQRDLDDPLDDLAVGRFGPCG